MLLLALTAITLLTLDGRNFGPLQTMQEGLRDVIAPIRSAADDVVSPVGNAWNGLTDYDAVVAENEALRAEIERLRGTSIQDETALAELEALRAEVGLVVEDYLVLLTEVVGGPIGNFEQFSIDIDAGSNDQVSQNMAVITSGGLVGLVSRVGAERSEVRLVSDPEFVIGVTFADGVVVARGTGDGETLRVVENLSQVPDVAVGDPVVTQSSLVPQGIAVGRVSAVERDDDGVLQEVEIELSAEVGHLQFVNVVLADPAIIDEERTDVLGNEFDTEVPANSDAPDSDEVPATPTTITGGAGP